MVHPSTPVTRAIPREPAPLELLQSLENDLLSGGLRHQGVIRWRIFVGPLIRVLGLVAPQHPIIGLQVFIATTKGVIVGTLDDQWLLVEFGCPVERLQGLLLLGRCHKEQVEEVGELALLLLLGVTTTPGVLFGY